MASALFLSNKYEEANVYFHSIKEYMFNDDSFYWNYGISLASAGLFEDAAEMLLAIQNEIWREDFTYTFWLAARNLSCISRFQLQCTLFQH